MYFIVTLCILASPVWLCNSHLPLYTSEVQQLRYETAFVDVRDGQTYKTVSIGPQIWMSENLRCILPGSVQNPNNPDEKYGRLYDLESIQSACPKGWHLPSDKEWDDVEIVHGMLPTFRNQGGWRGDHASQMRSNASWPLETDGQDTHGFNVLPAGYYTNGQMGLPEGYEGLAYAAAFWSALDEDGVGYARFMFTGKTFVNKWDATTDETDPSLSCRCIKD